MHRISAIALVLVALLVSFGEANRRPLLDAPASLSDFLTKPSTTPPTYIRCVGTTPEQRSCLAFNLYYHVPRRTFVVSGYDPARHSVADYSVSQYNISIPPLSETPNPNKTLTLPGLNVFWLFCHFGSWYSFGHALIHELYPLFIMLRNLLLGRVPTAFNLITRNADLSQRNGYPSVFRHLTSGVIGNNHVNLEDICQHAETTGTEWVLVEAATFGNSGLCQVAWKMHSTEGQPAYNMFSNEGWFQFRAWMMETVGMQQVSRLPDKPLIILNDKVGDNGVPEGRRRIHNIEEVASHLQHSFPNSQVKRVTFMKMSWKQQLELLARASLFITTEGSSGFRSVFLPPGANAIILAHPDNMTEGAEPLGVYFEFKFPQFHETDKYFPLTYVRYIKYPVDVEHTDEYINSTDTRDQGTSRLYDAHIVVKLDRIQAMVRDALATTRLHRALITSHFALRDGLT